MAESTLKVGQLESTITFDLPNAKVTEALESLLPSNFNAEGMTASEKLKAAHRAMLESVMVAVERKTMEREAETDQLEMQRIRRERRQRAQEMSALLKPASRRRNDDAGPAPSDS